MPTPTDTPIWFALMILPHLRVSRMGLSRAQTGHQKIIRINTDLADAWALIYL